MSFHLSFVPHWVGTNLHIFLVSPCFLLPHYLALFYFSVNAEFTEMYSNILKSLILLPESRVEAETEIKGEKTGFASTERNGLRKLAGTLALWHRFTLKTMHFLCVCVYVFMLAHICVSMFDIGGMGKKWDIMFSKLAMLKL